MEEVIFENPTTFLDQGKPNNFSLQGYIPWDSSKQVPEQAKICFPEVQGLMRFCHGISSHDPELHHLTVCATEAAPRFHLHLQFLLV